MSDFAGLGKYDLCANQHSTLKEWSRLGYGLTKVSPQG